MLAECSVARWLDKRDGFLGLRARIFDQLSHSRHVELAYHQHDNKVNIVNLDSTGRDQGDHVPYHPPIQKPVAMAYHVQIAQYGMVRIVEIIGGKPSWNRKDINNATLCQGQPLYYALPPCSFHSDPRSSRNIKTTTGMYSSARIRGDCSQFPYSL